MPIVRPDLDLCQGTMCAKNQAFRAACKAMYRSWRPAGTGMTSGWHRRCGQTHCRKRQGIATVPSSIEVMPDHVHMCSESDPGIAPARLVAQFKGYTSRVLRQEFQHLRSQLPSLWSRSYYIGSI